MKKKILVSLILIIAISFVSLRVLKKETPVNNVNLPKKTYVALGDSVSAGVGLTGNSDSSACGRTDESYPYLTAISMNLNLVNLSCSGATIKSGVDGGQNINNLLLDSQIDQLFKMTRPDFITLTIGANDINWSDYLTKCYTGRCGSFEDTANIDASLVILKNNLGNVLTKIQTKYASNTPHFVLTSYYKVFPADTTFACADMIGIEDSEANWIKLQQTKLDSTIQDVTSSYNFAKFVLTNFNGHELCTSKSWVQGINDKSPYHPSAEGQKEISKNIINTFKILTK